VEQFFKIGTEYFGGAPGYPSSFGLPRSPHVSISSSRSREDGDLALARGPKALRPKGSKRCVGLMQGIDWIFNGNEIGFGGDLDTHCPSSQHSFRFPRACQFPRCPLNQLIKYWISQSKIFSHSFSIGRIGRFQTRKVGHLFTRLIWWTHPDVNGQYSFKTQTPIANSRSPNSKSPQLPLLRD
jgi:hypothetical protein